METARRHHDDADGIVPRVLEAVTGATDREMLELDPLQRHVDGDALTDLVQSSAPVSVSFTYEGCSVVVHEDGSVDATRTDGGDDGELESL